MSELDTLQTLFLGVISVIGVVGTTFGVFILKKLDCFNAMFLNHEKRVSKLEEARDIFHGK